MQASSRVNMAYAYHHWTQPTDCRASAGAGGPKRRLQCQGRKAAPPPPPAGSDAGLLLALFVRRPPFIPPRLRSRPGRVEGGGGERGSKVKLRCCAIRLAPSFPLLGPCETQRPTNQAYQRDRLALLAANWFNSVPPPPATCSILAGSALPGARQGRSCTRDSSSVSHPLSGGMGEIAELRKKRPPGHLYCE